MEPRLPWDACRSCHPGNNVSWAGECTPKHATQHHYNELLMHQQTRPPTWPNLWMNTPVDHAEGKDGPRRDWTITRDADQQGPSRGQQGSVNTQPSTHPM